MSSGNGKFNSTRSEQGVRPTFQDHIARLVLRLTKYGRAKHHGDHESFYEEFFIKQKSRDEYTHDLRQVLCRRSVFDALRDLPADSIVVDLGCGLGTTINALVSSYKKIGIEFSKYNLSLATEGPDTGTWFVRGSALELPLKSNSVDAFILLEVLEHLPDELPVLSEISRALRPKGLFIISVPNAYYFPEYFRLLGHYRHYRRSQLANSLRGAGLEIEQYLENYPRFHLLHYYIYIFISIVHMILNRCGVRANSFYVRPFVGGMYHYIGDKLIKMTKKRSQEALGLDDYSTFIVAQKED